VAGRVVSQRDLVETITELRAVAGDLTRAANRETPDGAPAGTILVSSRVLDRHARFLETVSEELMLLITDKAVKVPP
jgi:hypothetical protein